MKNVFSRTLAALSLTIALTTSHSAWAISQEVYQQLDILANVFERVKSSYVEEVSDTKVIEAAINGMLVSLDPHSAYLSADSFKDMQESTKGEFGGLGIEVTMDKGVVKVVAPIDDTPAARAGLEAGDYIIQIDDEPVQGLTLGEAVDKMRGKVGTEIVIKIFRESSKESFDVTITRDIIKVKPVKFELKEAGIGYLRVTTFNAKVEDSMRDAFKQMRKENDDKDLRGLVLDLRNNPGGLLHQAVAASSLFLDGGEVVSTKGRIQGQSQRYNARPGDILDGKPIVVLINAGSASASEIVAGALQDHKRAIIIGTKSFGKGSVQTIMQLPGNAGMRLTTALYYTPSGRSIQAEGIEPDVVVKRAKIEEVDDNKFPTEASLRGHLELPDSALGAKGKESKDGKKEEGDAPKDYQLERALGMVKALSLWSKS